MRHLRAKLTYSNVMVNVLAILVIGGGSAYAATAGLPPNSVGPSQLKADSVGTQELRSDSVGAQQLQNGAVGLEALQSESVSASKLKDGSVTLAKLSAQVKGELKGPPGTTGAQGAAGPQGPAGTSAVSTSVSTEVVNQATATDTTPPKELSVQCPSGPVLGGGYVLHGTITPGSAKLRLQDVRRRR